MEKVITHFVIKEPIEFDCRDTIDVTPGSSPRSTFAGEMSSNAQSLGKEAKRGYAVTPYMTDSPVLKEMWKQRTYNTITTCCILFLKISENTEEIN